MIVQFIPIGFSGSEQIRNEKFWPLKYCTFTMWKTNWKTNA